MKKLPIILFIVFSILGALSFIFLNNIISIFCFAISSMSITYFFYTKNDNIKDIAASNVKAISFVLTFVLVAAFSFYITFFVKGKVDELRSKVKDYEAPVKLVAISTYSEQEADLSLQTYRSTLPDTSLVIVKNNSNMIIRNSTFTKYEGSSTNCEYSNLYGLNALFLNKAGSHTLLNNVEILSEEKCAIPVFATGEKSIVDITDSKIITKSSKDTGALAATIGGEINANNITVLVKGKNSPALTTLKDSHITVVNSLIETSSSSSPIISAEGSIELKNVAGTSNQDKILVLKENGKVSLNSSAFLTAGRGDSINNHSAIDIEGKDNCLNIKESTINISNKNLYYDVASIFNINNADTEIVLEKNEYNTGSNVFLKSKDSKIKMTLINENINKDFILNNTVLELILENSTFSGNLNDVNVTLDKNSKIVLNQDTKLKSLNNEIEDNSNIELNGYKLEIEE
ncbi:MAG: hypothetical protein IKP07_06325 [Bacilli bacterium]|nr:hypothetical protein [Bacilli bacterium]